MAQELQITPKSSRNALKTGCWSQFSPNRVLPPKSQTSQENVCTPIRALLNLKELVMATPPRRQLYKTFVETHGKNMFSAKLVVATPHPTLHKTSSKVCHLRLAQKCNVRLRKNATATPAMTRLWMCLRSCPGGKHSAHSPSLFLALAVLLHLYLCTSLEQGSACYPEAEWPNSAAAWNLPVI